MRSKEIIIFVFLALLFLANAGFCQEGPPPWLVYSEETSEAAGVSEKAPSEPSLETPPAWLAPTEEARTVTGTAEAPKIKAAPPVVKAIVFKDVPKNHWARPEVYDLVKLGLTQGYPDGTFRGNKNISRYETAMFVARLEKLVENLQLTADETRKKELEEKRKALKEELNKIKAEIKELKRTEEEEPKYGVFISRLRAGNFTSLGSTFSPGNIRPRFDYRIIAGGKTKINEQVSLAVNFDTMDMGFGGGGAGKGFALGLIDLEGDIRVNDVYSVKLTAGPGTIIHREPLDGLVPSDDGIAFVRPKNGVSLLADFGDFYMCGGYKALNVSSSGEATYSNLNLCIGRKFGKDSILTLKQASLTLDFNFKDALERPGDADVFKEKISMRFNPSPGFELEGKLGMSSFMGATDNTYYGFLIELVDVIEKGTTFKLRADVAGAEYLNYPNYLAEEDYLGANFFDKLIYSTQEGIADIGFEVVRNSGDLRLEAKADVRMSKEYKYGKDYPGTNSTFEIGIYRLSETFSSIGLVYRIFHFPGSPGIVTSDLLGIVARYEF